MELKKLQELVWESIEPIEGWCGRDRSDKLVELVHTHSPYLVVEVGVYAGKSLAALALAAEYACISDIWGIDPWTNEANLEGEPNQHREFWAALDLNAIYLRFIATIRGLSLDCQHVRARGEEAVHLFPDNSIDLLSLDGNHAELTSCRDIALWLPKLAGDGHLVMDDTGWETMQKAVGMVKAAGLKVVHDTGSWTVFRR